MPVKRCTERLVATHRYVWLEINEGVTTSRARVIAWEAKLELLLDTRDELRVTRNTRTATWIKDHARKGRRISTAASL